MIDDWLGAALVGLPDLFGFGFHLPGIEKENANAVNDVVHEEDEQDNFHGDGFGYE
jgi:hypothetical protein